MRTWPEYDLDRLSGSLLRVELYEARYLAVGEYHNVVDHLLRTAAAACLLDREADALTYIQRAATRTEEWLGMVDARIVPMTLFGELAATRGLLAVAIVGGKEEIGWRFLAQTANSPAGSVHNARLAACLLVGDADTADKSAKLCELADAGLGLPWRRFVTAVFAREHAAARKQIDVWLQEKQESTLTHEWGAYNEVPIEVSGALAAAARMGLPIKVSTNRVMTAFRQ